MVVKGNTQLHFQCYFSKGCTYVAIDHDHANRILEL